MLVKINWNPDRVELRKFGLVMLVAGAAIAAFLYFKEKPTAAGWVVTAGAMIAATSAFAPPIAMAFYRAWMSVALVMGTIVSTVLMFFIFFGVITFTGLVMRLFGRDPLNRKRVTKSSYWVDVTPTTDKKSYERLS